MSTGAAYANITPKKLLGYQDFSDRMLDYMRTLARDTTERVFGTDGVFETGLTLAGDTANKFKINGTSKITDGDGNIMQPSAAAVNSLIQFENTIGIPYYIACKYAVKPSGVVINPRTGMPDFLKWVEEIGVSGTPDSVTDNGNGTLTFRVDAVTEAGVTNAGRQVLVYKKTPGKNATAEAIAIETCTVVYTSGQNRITTVGAFGQDTASVVAADYEVILLGPSVKRNTDLRLVSGYAFIGIVTGAGLGNTPSTFTTADQNVIGISVSQFADVTRSDSHGFLKIHVKADSLDSGEDQIRVTNYAGVTKFKVDEAGNVVIGGNLTVSGTTTQQNLVQVNSSATITDSLTAGDAAGDSHTIKGSWAHKNASGTADYFRVDGSTGLVEVGTNLLPITNLAQDLGSATKVWANIYAANINLSGNLLPLADNTQDIGGISLRWQDIYGYSLDIVGHGVFGSASIGTATPASGVAFHVVHNNLPIRSERTTATTNASQTVVGLLTTCTADMVDGFGSGVSFTIQDTAAVVNPIANIFGVRYGADNSGRLSFYTYNAGTGTEKMSILPDGKVGIGISVPTTMLDVVGQMRVTEAGGLGGYIASAIGDGLFALSANNSAGSSFQLLTHQTTFASNTHVWRIRLGSAPTANAFMVGWFDGTPVLTVKQTGIGILTATPVNALDVEGAAAIGATYSGTSTAPANGLLVEGSIGIGTASVSANAKVDLTRSDASTTIAGLEIAQDSTGDALLRFALSTTRGWSLGIDNSDGDKFKIGTAANATSGVDAGTAFTIDPATGFTGLGTPTPSSRLHVLDAAYPPLRSVRSLSAGTLQYGAVAVKALTSVDMVDGFGAQVVFEIEDNAAVNNLLGAIGAMRDGADGSGALTFHTFVAGSATEHMRIAYDGALQFHRPDLSATRQSYIHFVSDDDFLVERNNNSFNLYLKFRRARGTNAAPLDVASGDDLGTILFEGRYNGAYYTAARITANVGGTPGVGDMPGRLSFWVTEDGTATPVERLRLSSVGNLGLNTTSLPAADPVAGRRFLSLKGTTRAGGIEFQTAEADADGTVTGIVQFSDINSTSTELRRATIVSSLQGTTANKRGGRLGFYTAEDNTDTLVQRLDIGRDGRVAIGSPAAAYDSFFSVESTIGATAARFGPDRPLYIMGADPNVGFNAYYYNAAWRYGKGSTAHYAGVFGFSPGSGVMQWLIGASSGAADAAITLTQVASMSIASFTLNNALDLTPQTLIGSTSGRAMVDSTTKKLNVHNGQEFGRYVPQVFALSARVSVSGNVPFMGTAYVIPPNTLKAGSVVHVKVSGTKDTLATGSVNITFNGVVVGAASVGPGTGTYVYAVDVATTVRVADGVLNVCGKHTVSISGNSTAVVVGATEQFLLESDVSNTVAVTVSGYGGSGNIHLDSYIVTVT